MQNNSYTHFISQIKEKLTQELPGIAAHKIMAPYSRISHQEAKSKFPASKEAGVLMLLYPLKEDIFFALIKRPPYEGVHGSQVSFPGGKREGNETLSQTAMRETEEEIGIPISNINLLGALTPIYIPPSKIFVHPFIACTQDKPAFKKDDYEVEYIIEISLTELLDPENVNYSDMEVGESSNKMTIMNVPFFDIKTETIWGATAMMLSEAKELLKKIGLPF
jgi:8-oxo-dGTP pyrophosphatase MutT (NUDIX family)